VLVDWVYSRTLLPPRKSLLILHRLSPQLATLWLLGIISVMHLLVLGRIGLSGDEAHYALYGLHLDWSYFDHPPLVGWLQALILPFSESNFALRLWPVGLSLLSSALIYGLTRSLYPQGSPWLGFIAVLLLQSLLVFQILSLAMLPDSPLLPLALAAAWLSYRILFEGREREWLLLGLVLGLAGLAKYTAVLLVPSILLMLVLTGRWRSLQTPWPWLAVLLALLVISPVLYWNWQHEWISFLYQLGHGVPAREWAVSRFGISLGGQLLGYGPLLVVLGLLALFSQRRQWRDPGMLLALVFGLPILLFFAWSSGLNTVLPHWTLVGWVMLIPMLASWLSQQWTRRWVRILAAIGLAYSLLFSLVLHTEFFHPWLPFADQRHPMADLHGWELAVERARLHREAMMPGEQAPVLFSGNWSYTSHIAWRARPDTVQTLGRDGDQHSIWFGSPQPGARGVLIVPRTMRRNVGQWLAMFDECTLVEQPSWSIRGRPATDFSLYLCEDYRGR